MIRDGNVNRSSIPPPRLPGGSGGQPKKINLVKFNIYKPNSVAFAYKEILDNFSKDEESNFNSVFKKIINKKGTLSGKCTINKKEEGLYHASAGIEKNTATVFYYHIDDNEVGIFGYGKH